MSSEAIMFNGYAFLLQACRRIAYPLAMLERLTPGVVSGSSQNSLIHKTLLSFRCHKSEPTSAMRHLYVQTLIGALGVIGPVEMSMYHATKPLRSSL